MVDVNRLIYWLNRACHNLDKDYCINEGGCCYVAYVIAKLMRRYDAGDYYLSIINDGLKETSQLEENTKKHIKKADDKNILIRGGTCNHYHITINNKRINGCGYFWNNKNLFRADLSIEPKDILWIYHNGYWCDTYDKKYNLRVYNVIEDIFRKCQKK